MYVQGSSSILCEGKQDGNIITIINKVCTSTVSHELSWHACTCHKKKMKRQNTKVGSVMHDQDCFAVHTLHLIFYRNPFNSIEITVYIL
jgi:hypothetical protein